ncbi:hypothetical protein F2Q70_00018067 [Brassica cretica]|uniref:Uncharacterized protein n=1 Tax=Brassica cretica TaxID=69181 RepID=A0A8S9I2K3_BRACR|nr:hypothetical protein F2Q70_00018067 [Brassica cretica]KAF2598220.1 hypothetical protein F2Q68_00011054 [Brassica cretica]
MHVYRTIADPKSRVEIVCAEQVVGLCVRQAMMTACYGGLVARKRSHWLLRTGADVHRYLSHFHVQERSRTCGAVVNKSCPASLKPVLNPNTTFDTDSVKQRPLVLLATKEYYLISRPHLQQPATAHPQRLRTVMAIAPTDHEFGTRQCIEMNRVGAWSLELGA